MSGEIAVTKGNRNVFADLGFDNPEEEHLKAQLIREIRDILKSRRIIQIKAAMMPGLKQPDVSAIISGRTEKFSIERLLRCIRRLDREVSIVVSRPRSCARSARGAGHCTKTTRMTPMNVKLLASSPIPFEIPSGGGADGPHGV